MKAGKKSGPRLTNVEFVTNMMEFSQHGRAWLRSSSSKAIRKWSGAGCRGWNRPKVDSPMISGQAWVGVAREIQQKLQERK